MPAFGSTLGKDAVGVYASITLGLVDQPSGLRPDARALLQRANDAYRREVGSGHEPGSACGFSPAWAASPTSPSAPSLAPADVAAAARAIDCRREPTERQRLLSAPRARRTPGQRRRASVQLEMGGAG